MYPPLPKGFMPTQDCAAAAAVAEPALVEALAAAGIPIMELRLGSKVQRYVSKARFDRWLLANIKPMARVGATR
jgi:hypothetical protein